MRTFMHCLVYGFVLVVAIGGGSARAAAICRFITEPQLSGSMPGTKWSLVSDQDGRGCIFQGERGDTLMLTVFPNPTEDRAKELYATLVKALAERMPVAPVSGIGDEAQAGTTAAKAARPEAAIVARSREYIQSISIYRPGRPADDALLKGLSDVALRAFVNVGVTSERFGSCEWLNADDAEGFLDRSTLTIQRTGAGSCLMFDGSADTLMVAVVAMPRDVQVSMMKRTGGCKHEPLPELGRDAFAQHSCTSGNTNAVHIYVWKNGKQASILFAPRQPHPEGSVELLKAVAGRVYEKM
ncbi:MAG TPA: hypothetical protein VKW08_24745 [Xanthobacteraceae bacterium]|jgi:hypothetical protein|nr:hypothetical protein [Xanthobacteraceae bacterium]